MFPHPPHFQSFGVGGARRPSAFSMSSAWELVSGWYRSGVSASSVLTSCGSGAPALARAMFPECRLFSASEFAGLGRAAFAVRAAALVRVLAASPSPLWVCFPEVACPASLRPGRSWSSGAGSGSWQETALAFGLGVPVLVFLPCGVMPPSSWGSSFWVEVAQRPGGCWWYLGPNQVLF